MEDFLCIDPPITLQQTESEPQNAMSHAHSDTAHKRERYDTTHEAAWAKWPWNSGLSQWKLQEKFMATFVAWLQQYPKASLTLSTSYTIRMSHSLHESLPFGLTNAPPPESPDETTNVLPGRNKFIKPLAKINSLYKINSLNVSD